MRNSNDQYRRWKTEQGRKEMTRREACAMALGFNPALRMMRRAALQVRVPGPGGKPASGGGGGGSWSSYTNHHTITINSSQVPSPQSNYTLYFKGDPALKGTGSSGPVTSANGYDIIFAADSGGVTLYNFELVPGTYDPTSGAGEWRIGPISTITTGTVIYVACGNSSVTMFQGGAAGSAWDSSFELVQHFGTPSSLSLSDSTANPLTPTNSGVTAGTGWDGLGGAGVFGGSQFYTLANAAKVNNWTAQTISFWANWGSVTPFGRIIEKGANNEWEISGDSNLTGVGVYIQNLGVNTTVGIAQTIASGATWYKVDCTLNNSTGALQIYINAGSPTSGTSTTLATVLTHDINVGQYGGGGFNFAGLIDELSISNGVRSADWITTAYNNESAPASFYTFA